jgi:nucleoside-diphosphate kinase
MLPPAMERTFAMIKPDGVKRGLTAEILARIQRKGYRVVGLKQFVISRELAENHYGEHKERPFFGELVTLLPRARWSPSPLKARTPFWAGAA